MKTKNRLRRFQKSLGASGKITKSLFARVAVQHFHLGVPLQDGPCFQNRADAVAWEMGWKKTNAWHLGYQAGLDEVAKETNPYIPLNGLTVNTAENTTLAKKWRNGYRAARFFLTSS